MSWTYKITPNNTGDVWTPWLCHGFQWNISGIFESEPVGVFERLFPGQEACIPTMKAEVSVDPGRAAGVRGTGQARSHVAVVQQIETWTLLCNVSTDSSGHREDQVRSRVWKHAAQCLVRAQWALSNSVLISVTRGYRRGISSACGAAAAGESGSHIKGDGHPCLWSGCWGWPLTRRMAVEARPPCPVTAPTAHVLHTVMPSLPWGTCSPARLSCVRGIYHGVACFRFVVCTVSNYGIEHPAASSI